MPSASAFAFPQRDTQFRRRLLRWFDREKRNLPWRGTRDPYSILVSEIMLQQTRVAVVLERYKKFISRFPTVDRLASAREHTVLAAWSGLGYYRRARSLHAAARHIRSAGAFPDSAAALSQLPGIGRYTAGAVASIAFSEPVAVVDGNVKRVIERLLGAPRKIKPPYSALRQAELWRIAGKLLAPRRPGDFNQAMMELGALVCLPGRPLCQRCPVASLCASRGRTTKSKQQPRRKAVLTYALLRENGRVLLRQRPDDSKLMPGMWELPTLSETTSNTQLIMTLRHSITSTDYVVHVFAARHHQEGGKWFRLESLDRLALTGLARKILKRL